MDSESQKDRQAVFERSVLRRLRVDHSLLGLDLHGHQDFQQPANGAATKVTEAHEAVEDVPRQSLDHEISGFDDSIHHGGESDRIYYFYGVSVALARVHVGLFGKPDRQRPELVDGSVLRSGRPQSEGRRRRVVLAEWITRTLGRDKPADPVFDVLVLYTHYFDHSWLW